MIDHSLLDEPPKPGAPKKKKVQLLPQAKSNQISILRKQFKVTDYELIRQIFDVEKSAGIMQTNHFEALLQCVPTDVQVDCPSSSSPSLLLRELELRSGGDSGAASLKFLALSSLLGVFISNNHHHRVLTGT